MALFHFHATQVKRSAGQSAIASAAYRAGQKLHSEYYGEDSDYTRKGGVICTGILLPSHAPPEYKDRETLWNAVEKAERGKNAQLAYSFDIALQNELTMDENILLVRRFLSEQFISRGMVTDFAIHAPEKEDGGIQNPHFHVLCPIRPLDASGKWGLKQRRVYRLDEAGNRITDGNGKLLFDAIPTTDWGDPATLETWRAAWSELCNSMFEEKGLDCRIDHRSYLRQGLDLLPTVHEGPSVRQMEAKGIATEKGELNRWIKATNALIKDLKHKIASLFDWIKDVREELTAPQAPNLAELLGAYYNGRNAGAWSQRAKAGNLKQFADTVNYLTENKLLIVEDLEARVAAHSDRVDALQASMKDKAGHRKELEELLRYAESYQKLKPIYDEMNAIKFKGRREKFKEAHDGDLRLFYLARRKLEKYFSSDSKLPLTAWRREHDRLKQEYEAIYQQYKPLRADLKKLWEVKRSVDSALRQREQTREAPARKQDIER